MNLDGEIALITGASRGIGQAIARELGRRGAIVLGSATSEAGAKAITQDLQAREIRGRGIKLDVTDPASIEDVMQVITREFGNPGILVNNAGITRDNLLMRMKDMEWDEIINTNLSSVYRLSKAVLRGMMKARAGRIISITSVVASMGNAGQTNYVASKAAIEGFTRALALEVGSRNISVNSIAPGFIATDMTQALTADQQRAMLARIPIGRMGEVDEVASLVAFLVSESAGYITGETIHINGGMYMN